MDEAARNVQYVSWFQLGRQQGPSKVTLDDLRWMVVQRQLELRLVDLPALGSVELQNEDVVAVHMRLKSLRARRRQVEIDTDRMTEIVAEPGAE
jgi:hypothetical protein